MRRRGAVFHAAAMLGVMLASSSVAAQLALRGTEDPAYLIARSIFVGVPLALILISYCVYRVLKERRRRKARAELLRKNPELANDWITNQSSFPKSD